MKETQVYNFDRRTLNRIASVFTSKHILNFKSDFLIGGVTQQTSLKDVYNSYYELMNAEYRCEYLYKNEIVKQILLKNHKNEARLYTELDIYESKADVVIMNGTSTAYEIKTELDNFDRLEKQLASYRLVFDKIYVVTHESKLEALKKIIGKDIGIMILNNDSILEKKRSARSNVKNVRPESIFNLLRREEFVQIIKECFGKVPNAKPVHIFGECKKLFVQLSSEEAHDQMVKVMRCRKIPFYKEELFEVLPDSLKLLGLTGKITKKESVLLSQKLSAKLTCA